MKIGFGIVGTGVMAANHAEAIRKIKDAKLVAVGSRSKERAEAFAKRYNITPYADYDEMLKNKEINVIDIVTYNHLHADLAIKAANMGKHIIVEKPIDISLKKAEKLISICKKKGVKLSVIFQKRFGKAIQKLKWVIDSGKLGKLLLGYVSIRWRRSQAYYDSSNGWRKYNKYAGGGVLMVHAIHSIDILQWLMGPVKSVSGKICTLTHDMEGEDIGAGLLKFKNGALGIIDGTTSVRCNTPDRIEIHGEKGSIVIERNRITTWNFSKNPIISKIVSAMHSLIPMKRGSIKDQIKDVIDAIKNNRKPLIDGNDGKRALEIILGIYHSNKIGKEVNLSLSIGEYA